MFKSTVSKLFLTATLFAALAAAAVLGTPAQRASGASSFRMMTGRTEIFTPLPVALYIIGGFVGLGVAGIIGAFRYQRGG